MKRDVADFIAKCIVCQQVKVEHKRPGWLYPEIEFLKWKWEVINYGFRYRYSSVS